MPIRIKYSIFPRRRGRQLLDQIPRLWFAAVASSLLCSCVGPTGASRDTLPVPPAPAPQVDQSQASSPASVAPRVDQSVGNAASPDSSGRAQIALVQHTEPQPNTDSHPQPDMRIAAAIESYPAEQRIDDPAIASQACPIACPPAAGCMPGGNCPPANGVAMGSARVNADEFLCDGGDRLLPIHYDRTFRNGLNTEDTVGEWTDPAGGHHVVPSNKVCVYSPRFGEVRTFSTPVGGVKVDSLISANEFQRGIGLDSRTYLETEIQNNQLDVARVRSRASGLDTEDIVSGMNQATALSLNLGDTPPIVGTAFVSRGELKRGEEAFIADGIQAAVKWTRTQFPVIAAKDISAQEVRAVFRPAEITGLEDMNKPGHLRIVKLADKPAAKAGEVITFTIRYDNLGDKPVHHVTIVDNLTPRLELIEGSGSSDRPGRLDLEPNGEGSYVLTFIINDPVEGKSGGTVTFKARVK